MSTTIFHRLLFTRRFRVTQLFSALLAFTLFSLSAQLHASVDDIDQKDPKAWVELMNNQKGLVEVDGYFTYERGSRSSSYHYMRQISESETRQRLVFLEGEAQELIFDAGILRCLLPKGQCGQSLREAEIKSILNVRKNFTDAWDYYDAELLSDTRIAGRVVKQIKVQPKTDDRFPYIFAIDAEQGVMLKMMMTTTEGNMLERFRYVAIEFNGVTKQKFEQGLENYQEEVMDVHQGGQYSPSKARVEEQLGINVTLDWLPAGFVEKNPAADLANNASSRTFSDGLSSFSLFVESIDGGLGDVDEKSPALSTVSGGTAVSARYAKVSSGVYQLTVIGELPLATVEKISENLQVK